MKLATYPFMLLLFVAAWIPFLDRARADDTAPATAKARYVGLGVEWKLDGSSLLVMKVLADSLAERAGLVVGDRILAIGGRPTANLSSKELAELLKGKAGTAVLLAVAGKDKEVRPVEIVRGGFDVPPTMPDGVAAAAQAHLRLRAQPEEREERPMPARADLDAVREAIEREVRYIARAGGLTHDESNLLAQEGAKAIARRRGSFAVEGDRVVRRHLVVVNGRKVLGAEESETLEQVARRELTQALKDLDREAWEQFDAERERREERSRQSDVLTQVAALDEALLLTVEQRNEFCNLLSTRWFELCHGPASGDAHLDVVQLCMCATQAMNEFSFPHAELEAVLRPSQIAAFESCSRPPGWKSWS
ncbi:MAG: S41 family peptidase, partial [Pirellulales bacterium]